MFPVTVLQSRPDDDRLLPAARLWVHSDSPTAHCAAAQVFAAHPDPIDTPALEDLLNDPFTVDEPYSVSPWSGHEYVIRQAAVKALAKRSAPLPAVALLKPRTDLYHPLSWLLLFWLIPIPLYLIVRHMIRRRLRRPRSTFHQALISLVTFACLYLAFLTALIYARGRHTADDIVYAQNGRLINLTFVGGHAYFETATGWPGDSPLVHLACTPGLTSSHQANVTSLRHGFGGGGWGHFYEDRWPQWPTFDVGADWFRPVIAYPFGWRTTGVSFWCPGFAAGISYTYPFILFLLFPATRPDRHDVPQRPPPPSSRTESVPRLRLRPARPRRHPQPPLPRVRHPNASRCRPAIDDRLPRGILPATELPLLRSPAVFLNLAIEDHVDRAQLFGPGDRNLKLLAKSLGVHLGARGNVLHVSGDPAAVSRAAAAFAELQRLLHQHKTLTREHVLLAIRQVNDQMEGGVDPQELDVLAQGQLIRPKTEGQRRYIKAISAHDFVFCDGPAGTGKTFLAVALAVSMLRRGVVRRLVLVRPAVEAGEKLGFLPGTLEEKVNPYLRPLIDALHDMMPFEQIRRFMANDIIEIAPLAYMRGRTLNECMVILDEAQNTTRPDADVPDPPRRTAPR